MPEVFSRVLVCGENSLIMKICWLVSLDSSDREVKITRRTTHHRRNRGQRKKSYHFDYIIIHEGHSSKLSSGATEGSHSETISCDILMK